MGQKGALEGHPVRSASWLPKKKRLRALVAWCLGLLWETTEVAALMKNKFLQDPQPIPTTRGQDDFERAGGTQEIACAQPMVSKSWSSWPLALYYG